jgi:hypothetical protein
MVAPSIFALAAALANSGAPTAIDVFRSACLEGTVRLHANEVRQQDVKAINPKALYLLQKVDNSFEKNQLGKVKWAISELPAVTFKFLSGKEMYLVIPDASEGTGPKTMCAVVVNDDQLQPAFNLMTAYEAKNSQGKIIKPTTSAVSVWVDPHWLSATRLGDWTIISTIRGNLPSFVEKVIADHNAKASK